MSETHFVRFAHHLLKIKGPMDINTLRAAFKQQDNDVADHEDDEELVKDDRFEKVDETGFWFVK